MSMQSEDPTAEPAEVIERALEVNQPNPPLPPIMTAQTFECKKCGATFADEGSATVHIQTCKGLEDLPEEDEDKAKSPTIQSDVSEGRRTENRGFHNTFTVAA